MMNVSDDLVHNFIVDLKKKDIHPIDRAKIIKDYMKEKNLSIKKLSLEFALPTATIHDWINFGKIDKIKYDALIASGIGKTEIFKELRNSDYKRPKLDIKEFNILIEDINSKLRGFITNPTYNDKTLDLIKELKNTLNRLELHLERKIRGK